MKAISPRRLRRLAAGLAITGALTGVTASGAAAAYDPSDPAQTAQYEEALDLGTKAYVFGVPLLNMQKTFKVATSTNVCDNRGHGPVNQFCPWRVLTGIDDHDIVSPNADTLYSLAWLNLSKQPIVVHVPDTGGRFNVVPFLSPYQENFGNIGNGAADVLAPGDYTLTGPKHHGEKIPSGTTEIQSPYNRVWVGQRTYIDNTDTADYAPVHAIQDATTLTPANKWDEDKPYVPRAPRHPDTTVGAATIPGTQPGDDPIDFWDALNAEMRKFRPTPADQPLLDQLATVGIAPGARPVSCNHKLSDATLAGLRDAVAAGKAKVGAILKQRFAAGFAAHNGYLVEPVGNYGTDYELRGLIDQIGLGALPKNVAVYPIAQTDRLGAPLSGANRYVLHFNGPANPLAQLPIPADAFWSVTMYDSSGFFVPNALDRWLINDRSDLHYNADGSLDIYIQPNAPSDPDQLKNWLPSPADAPFRIVTRLYAPPADKIAGILDGTAWKSGTILPCASGATPAFPPSGISAPIACAS